MTHRLALAVLTAACWLAATCAVQSWKVRGDDDPYDAQVHQGAVAPAGDGCIVSDLERPCMPIPEDMQANIVAVVQCESRWDPRAVGMLGERGLLQIHPIHRAPMAKAGLDFGQEGDRLRWAIRIFEGNGWGPWACRP